MLVYLMLFVIALGYIEFLKWAVYIIVFIIYLLGKIFRFETNFLPDLLG